VDQRDFFILRAVRYIGYGKGNCASTYHLRAPPPLVRYRIIQKFLSNVVCKSDFVTNFETIFVLADETNLTGTPVPKKES